MGIGKDVIAKESYAECLGKLYRTHSLKLGLERTKMLSECFNNPGDTYKTVHVAGTNGKGSVSYKISMCLKVRNYRVGLFTSPHIFSIRERIRVNDECISEEDFVRLVNEVWRKADELDLKPTFFEIVTIVAYLFFKSKKVDYAVVETGIGGRLDATNILRKPEVVVITSIGYDHQELLGAQLSSICDEKIGIMKEGTNVVIGPSVSIYKNVFNRAKDLNCVVKVVPPEPRGESFDEENTRIAEEALKILKVQVSSDPILKSVICVKPPLRMQYLATEQIQHVKKKISSPSGSFTNGSAMTNAMSSGMTTAMTNGIGVPLAVILDVGHNETAVDRLCQNINCLHKGKPIRVCVSATRPRSLAIFQPLVAHFQGLLQVRAPKATRSSETERNETEQNATKRNDDVLYLPSVNDRTYDFGEVADMLNSDEQISGELRGVLLRSAEKVTSWLEGTGKGGSPGDNLYTRGTIPLIVKNAFLECCKDNSILLICGTFFMFDEVLPAFDIHSDLQDPISMNEPSYI
ncbi:dihydrofolate synthase/folylpolyglutamate synthase [Plasmodium inui San Antonio 1]|uniref:Dihydrofolate synthase/folylpolyglutamate synthase n=1 Tax=Plasmodium inui San Antonio 1 TaxID=1237626 RepID=W7ACW4_9APIC|nr:dihydrofolate synthase/folylpolyglutamate synthase [Plasmodium inui San Antonio 1]EUD69148.1 dihydrofolate synthase/folylpolyglutamate synthase [Plasmodium inui San Antonio 1]